MCFSMVQRRFSVLAKINDTDLLLAIESNLTDSFNNMGAPYCKRKFNNWDFAGSSANHTL